MNKNFHIIIYLLFITNLFGQKTQGSFEKIIDNFKNSWYNQYSRKISDSITSSSLYKTNQFNISISENPIVFDTLHLVIKNPYYTDDFEDYDDNYINYPVSYSVIFENKLISLFRNGKFVCHNLLNFERDLTFEKILNTKKFKYHWIINNKIGARSIGGKTYIWDNNKWIKLETNFPLKKQPKLFEDKEFIVFGDCHGEWGGTVYFFDKISKVTYFTESTCTNSVFKKDGNYIVLADLGHMIGSTEIKMIENPRLLSKAKKGEINKVKNGKALGYNEKSEAFKKVSDYHNIQFLSTFKYGERQLFICHLMEDELTFLAEIKENEIQIVHPFFNNGINFHNQVTSPFGESTLINIASYDTALDKEVSVIMIENNKIIKIDWNENQR